jgi:hypothetical protein
MLQQQIVALFGSQHCQSIDHANSVEALAPQVRRVYCRLDSKPPDPG